VEKKKPKGAGKERARDAAVALQKIPGSSTGGKITVSLKGGGEGKPQKKEEMRVS